MNIGLKLGRLIEVQEEVLQSNQEVLKDIESLKARDDIAPGMSDTPQVKVDLAEPAPSKLNKTRSFKETFFKSFQPDIFNKEAAKDRRG